MSGSLTRSAFLALCASIALTAHAPVLAQATAKMTLRLDWKPGGQHVPFYLGKERGYYTAEGIDLTIVAGSGSSDSVKQVGAASVDVALVDALVLVQAAEQGVPVKAVAAYYQRTPIALLSPKAKPVTSVQQLTTGIKVGSKRASATYQGLMALLAVNKIDAKKVNLVDIGFGVQPLLVGQVDSLMGFTMNESIEAESAGMPIHEMLIADQGVNAYGLMLVVNDKLLAAKPELVRGFVRATRRAVEAAAADKQAAVQALAKSVSEVDLAREVRVLAKTVPFWSTKGADMASFGGQTAAGWQQTVETAKRVGLVETSPAATTLFAAGMDR